MPGEKNAEGAVAVERGVMTDRLEYMADILLELRAMAAEAGCETLAGLLSLSHAEALRQAGYVKTNTRL